MRRGETAPRYNRRMRQVVAGVLERDGRILIGQRRAGQSHALEWEFPGGKVEPGETPEQALARELEEELGIRSGAGEEILRYEYSYPDRPPIILIFLRVRSWEGEPQHLNYSEMRWERLERLREYSFVAGDERFLREVCRQGLRP
ncbi:MAG: 8-oxo-dGTP diphosphatase MutT [Bryobacteraceae bacterium]